MDITHHLKIYYFLNLQSHDLSKIYSFYTNFRTFFLNSAFISPDYKLNTLIASFKLKN